MSMSTVTFKIGLTIVSTFLASIPTLIWLGMHSMLAPEGFLQNLFVVGLGMYFLGFIQIMLFVAWMFALTAIYSD